MRNVVYLSNRSERKLENGESTFTLPRLELEMALELGTDRSCWIDMVRDATHHAGGEVLFVLPEFDENGEIRQRVMIRLREDDLVQLAFVCQTDEGYAIVDENRIDPELAGFARATVNVMQHLRADDRIFGPLAEGVQ